jgi:hypothetical protein
VPVAEHTHKEKDTPTAQKRRGRRTYVLAEIERALAVLSIVDGNTRRASEMLKADGLHVRPQTLFKWSRDTYSDLYLRVRFELSRHLEAAREERYRELARRFDSPPPQEADTDD